MKTASLVLGILSICGMAIGFLPYFAPLCWINIPLSIVSLVVSIIAYIKEDELTNGNVKKGLILCSIAAFFALFRLIIGGEFL